MGIALALLVLACPKQLIIVPPVPDPPTAKSGGEIRMSDDVRNIISRHLNKKQTKAMRSALPGIGQYTLGPQPLSDDDEAILAGPDGGVLLDPAAAGVQGTGTEADPYVGALAATIAALPQGTQKLIVPAGHYEELGLMVRPGLWLEAREGAVLVPPPDVTYSPQERTRILYLGSESALIGFEIDGSRATGITAVYVDEDSAGAVIARNHIHDIPDRHGIAGVGTAAIVIANRIENTGRSGVRTGSRWVVRDNVVRYAGIDRPDGGGGDDGIIAGNLASGTIIENNLIFSAKRPNGRHAIGGQTADNTTIRGNLCILEGRVRGGIVLSDRCSNNLVAGNVVLCIPENGERTSLGMLGFGSGNVFEGNVVVSTEYGCSIVKPTSERNVVRDNALFVSVQGVRLLDAGPGTQQSNNTTVIGR